MPLMEWDDSFTVGVEQFDQHHKQLINLLNKTCDDMVDGIGHETLGATLDDLIDYATYHFAAEEQWMKEHAYHGLQQHCEEHNRLSGRVVEIQIDYHSGKTRLSLEVLQFLRNWLIDHILKTDADYGHFASKPSKSPV